MRTRTEHDARRSRGGIRTVFGTLAAIGLVVCPLSKTRADDATFQALGQLDLDSKPVGSLAHGISADGSRVVGFSYLFDADLRRTEGRGFVWSVATGMIDLGLADNGGLDSTSATAISDDGNIVSGNNGFTLDGYYEVRNGMFWTGALGGDPIGTVFDRALSMNDVTPDGLIIVGATRVPGPWPVIDSAFYYTDDLGIVELGYLPDGVYSWAEATSSDGSVIVGYGDGDGAIAAFIWTESTGVQFLDGQEPGVISQAFGISPDGAIVAGTYGLPDEEACLWTRADGFALLGKIDGSRKSYALDLSGDGRVVVGYSWWDWDEFEACISIDGAGMRSLFDVLTVDHGLDLTGWTLRRATAISDDGTRICGYGFNPDGHLEAFLVDLDGPDAGPALTFDGTCPDSGRGTITWSGATADGSIGLLLSRDTGSFTIPSGPCAGTQLGLGTRGLRLVRVADSDVDGAGRLSRQVPAAACGAYLQIVDIETCTTSNVVRIE